MNLNEDEPLISTAEQNKCISCHLPLCGIAGEPCLPYSLREIVMGAATKFIILLNYMQRVVRHCSLIILCHARAHSLERWSESQLTIPQLILISHIAAEMSILG
jgi:hypothetical protein